MTRPFEYRGYRCEGWTTPYDEDVMRCVGEGVCGRRHTIFAECGLDPKAVNRYSAKGRIDAHRRREWAEQWSRSEHD